MKKIASILAAHALLCASLAPVPAQQPTPTPTPAAPITRPQQQAVTPAAETGADDEVVRITVNLVQMDVVVTDKRGRQVTDLRAEDFQVFEDGRAQQITNFSYVSNTPAGAVVLPEAKIARSKEADKLGPPVPPVRLRPEQVRRTIALVVDDLGLSFESIYQARRALKKFVDEQMQPNDLVAIIRTSAGVGALQQFTSDRRQLYAAIERVKWYASGRGGVNVFQSVEADLVSATGGAATGGAATGRAADNSSGRADVDEMNDFREQLFSVGTLGAVNYVVRGMQELPGRKSIVLLSDGFSLGASNRERQTRVIDSLSRLIELATRASVVVYTVDVRGLVYTGPTAADNLSDMTAQQIGELSSQRGRQINDTRDGLIQLARETGGLAFYNSNDVGAGVRKVLEDQSGFYLIGYRPAGETFDRRFHRLSAKVKNRPDLKVRTRVGFYGVPDDALRPAPRTKQQQLIAALMSPFSAGDVDLRLATFFTATPRQQAIVSSQMRLDLGGLKFTRLPDGQHEASIELIGVAFGANGAVVDQRGITQTMRLPEADYARAVRSGYFYTFNVPVKRAGAYQLRVAVRDTATGRVGSASQFVEVPDLKQKRIALSGLVLSGSKLTNLAAAGVKQPGAPAPAPASAAAAAASQPEGASATPPDPEANPAVRRFRTGTALDFAYIIFNARADPATRLPQVVTQVRLFREGTLVYAGQEKPVALTGQTDPRRVVVGNRLNLGTILTPGEYVLQVVVTDTLAKPTDKHRTTTQWSDFEIVK